MSHEEEVVEFLKQEMTDPKVVHDLKKYTEVFKIVKRAMVEQDAATYHGLGSSTEMAQVCHNATTTIMGIFL